MTKSKRKLKKIKNYRKTKLKFQKGGNLELIIKNITDNLVCLSFIFLFFLY